MISLTGPISSISTNIQNGFVSETIIPSDIIEAMSSFFPGGLSNIGLETLKDKSVFKITDKNYFPERLAVLRRSFPTWTQARCEREVQITKWVAQSKAGPEVLAVSKDSRFMILEYFNGGVLQPNMPIDLKEFAICLRNLHSIGLPPCIATETHSTTFFRFDGQFEQLKTLYTPFPEWLKVLGENVKQNERTLAKYPRRVLCHLDLHCHNIMRHDGRMMLVDYGMTGPDHPYIDLANFAMYMCLSVEQEKELLAHYLGTDLDGETYRDYVFFRPLVYVNKITWNLIKAAKAGATSELLEEVWKEKDIFPINEAFNWIYLQQRERTATDYVRYARAAFWHFHHKRSDEKIMEKL